MSKEMSTREAVEILNNFKNEDYNCKYTLTEVKQALEIVLAYIKELGEINFNLLNNGVPREVFRELQLELKKEKQENEANKKRIEEIIQKLDIDIKRNKRRKIEHNTESNTYSNMLIVYEPEIIKEILEELLKGRKKNGINKKSRL